MTYEPVDIVEQLTKDESDGCPAWVAAYVGAWRDALVAELERRVARIGHYTADEYAQGAAEAYRHAARLVKGEAG